MNPQPLVTRRADAERNRARILAVAREAFDEPGPEPSMAEIARRAGVGMATLYRNFPGRLDLVFALYSDEVDEICAEAQLARPGTAGQAFFAWLARFHAAGARQGPLASALVAGSEGDTSAIEAVRARVVAAAQPLFAAAQLTGEVRDDVSLRQVLEATVAVGQVADDPTAPGRTIDVLLDGLCHPRPPGSAASSLDSAG